MWERPSEYAASKYIGIVYISTTIAVWRCSQSVLNKAGSPDIVLSSVGKSSHFGMVRGQGYGYAISTSVDSEDSIAFKEVNTSGRAFEWGQIPLRPNGIARISPDKFYFVLQAGNITEFRSGYGWLHLRISCGIALTYCQNGLCFSSTWLSTNLVVSGDLTPVLSAKVYKKTFPALSRTMFITEILFVTVCAKKRNVRKVTVS